MSSGTQQSQAFAVSSLAQANLKTFPVFISSQSHSNGISDDHIVYTTESSTLPGREGAGSPYASVFVFILVIPVVIFILIGIYMYALAKYTADHNVENVSSSITNVPIDDIGEAELGDEFIPAVGQQQYQPHIEPHGIRYLPSYSEAMQWSRCQGTQSECARDSTQQSTTQNDQNTQNLRDTNFTEQSRSRHVDNTLPNLGVSNVRDTI